MFLEETIGSLDAEADSGVSTDEIDYMEPSKLPGTRPKRDSITRGKLETHGLALVCKGECFAMAALAQQAGRSVFSNGKVSCVYVVHDFISLFA